MQKNLTFYAHMIYWGKRYDKIDKRRRAES
jgi:hypothetical protein